MQSSHKWNHHSFSSKVKEVQIMPHSNGHVRNINFRYEKGEPPKPEMGQYASFCCEETTGEFINALEGGFKGGILHYIKVFTNLGRSSAFCRSDLEDYCDRFVFKA